MKKWKILGCFAAFALAFSIGCDHGDDAKSNADYIAAADCTGIDAAANTYTKAVKAIIDANCATSGCHDSDSKQHGLDLEGFAATKDAFQNHDDIFCSIYQDSDCEAMPVGSKLSDSDIAKISCWAKNGYAE